MIELCKRSILTLKNIRFGHRLVTRSMPQGIGGSFFEKKLTSLLSVAIMAGIAREQHAVGGRQGVMPLLDKGSTPFDWSHEELVFAYDRWEALRAVFRDGWSRKVKYHS